MFDVLIGFFIGTFFGIGIGAYIEQSRYKLEKEVLEKELDQLVKILMGKSK